MLSQDALEGMCMAKSLAHGCYADGSTACCCFRTRWRACPWPRAWPGRTATSRMRPRISRVGERGLRRYSTRTEWAGPLAHTPPGSLRHPSQCHPCTLLTLPSAPVSAALGLANLAGSACCCYNATGSFSRSAVNNDVGAKTQLASGRQWGSRDGWLFECWGHSG